MPNHHKRRNVPLCLISIGNEDSGTMILEYGDGRTEKKILSKGALNTRIQQTGQDEIHANAGRYSISSIMATSNIINPNKSGLVTQAEYNDPIGSAEGRILRWCHANGERDGNGIYALISGMAVNADPSHASEIGQWDNLYVTKVMVLAESHYATDVPGARPTLHWI